MSTVFEHVLTQEYKRLAEALEDAYKHLCSAKREQCEEHEEGEECDEGCEEDQPPTGEKLGKAYESIKQAMVIWYDNCALPDGESLLKQYEVDTWAPAHKLVPNRNRGKLDCYITSLRTLVNSMRDSYMFKYGLVAFGLGALRDRIVAVSKILLDLLSGGEVAVETFERYLTWYAHGADLMTKYMNAQAQDEEDKISVEDIVNDRRIATYALLKTFDCDGTAMLSFSADMANLASTMLSFVKLASRLYASFDEDLAAGVINAFISKKAKNPDDSDLDNMKTLLDLHKYLHHKVCDSATESDGLLYALRVLAETAAGAYQQALCTEMADRVAFFANTAEARQFIKRFESGRLWTLEAQDG